MLLTQEDLERIESQGYKRRDFCINRKQAGGFWQLRNVENRCYFLLKEGKCSIYDIRPKGCKLYPLILILDTDDIVIDDDCREQKWFAKQIYNSEQEKSIRFLANTLLTENLENSL
jgi:Fe-S-cluster containining protein